MSEGEKKNPRARQFNNRGDGGKTYNISGAKSSRALHTGGCMIMRREKTRSSGAAIPS